jgi:hypothetical protein
MTPLSLSTIHGPGHFLSPKAFPEVAEWLPANSFGLENFTGAYLCLAGDMPVLCHEAASTDLILDLFRYADIPVARDIRRYRDEADYLAQVRKLLAEGLRAVTIYPTPERVLPPGTNWINPALQALLNNKASLPRLTPSYGVPPRHEIAAAGLAQALRRPGALPVVVKVATDQASGGGADVVVCRSRRHVRRAVERLGSADRLVVEEFVSAIRNDCLHYAIDQSGTVSYLGTAQQVCDRRGAHFGNWVDTQDAGGPSAIVLGLAIAQEAARLGYVGLAGLDILTRKDGRAFAIDLNFRPASSSAQIALRDGIWQRRGTPLSRLSFASYAGSMADAAARLKPFIAENRLLPLGAFDPEGGFGGARPFLRLLAIGRDRAEIEATFAAQTRAGFVIGGWKPKSFIPRLLGGLPALWRKAAAF